MGKRTGGNEGEGGRKNVLLVVAWFFAKIHLGYGFG